jgi:oligoendopeptidase F
VDQIQKEHQQVLGLSDYKPWDVAVQATRTKPLSPFQDVDQLVDGTVKILERVDPLFGDVLRQLESEGLLDLENRSGKSPGGFCSPLPVTGLSFIFMNATGTPRDVTTLIHEGGHAVHNFLMQRQPLSAYRSADKEAAELASMGMELLTMDQWSVFYPDQEALQQAKKEHLQKILTFFPWAVVVDQFQHWMYEHPDHTAEERKEKFVELAREMSYHGVDTRGIEDILAVRWMLQPHIFEVPFYYIEYVIAQLGALELWINYQEDPEGTLIRFKQALSLGSSESLPEVYQRAGLHFDLSENRLNRLVTHLYHALESLEGREITINDK